MTRLGINEALDVAQPAEVLVLLLDVDVVGHKDGQRLGDAALLEEALHEDLQVLVEGAKRRAWVDVGALLGGLGGLGAGELGVGVVVQVLDDNVAVLGGGVDAEGAGLAGLLDDDGQVDGRGRLLVHVGLVHLVLGVLRLALARLGGLHLVADVLVLLEAGLVGVKVVDVGNGEGNGDPGNTVSRRAFCKDALERSEEPKTYFSSPKSRTSLTTSWPGVSISSKGLFSRKSLTLDGSCSLAFISSSIWISLSILAESSSSVSPSAARRPAVVEKPAPVAARITLKLEALAAVATPGRARPWRIEALAMRPIVRGAERARERMESMV